MWVVVYMWVVAYVCVGGGDNVAHVCPLSSCSALKPQDVRLSVSTIMSWGWRMDHPMSSM